MVDLMYLYSWHSDDDDEEDDLDVDDLHGRHHLLVHPLHHVIPREPAVVPHTGEGLIVFAGHLNVD